MQLLEPYTVQAFWYVAEGEADKRGEKPNSLLPVFPCKRCMNRISRGCYCAPVYFTVRCPMLGGRTVKLATSLPSCVSSSGRKDPIQHCTVHYTALYSALYNILH